MTADELLRDLNELVDAGLLEPDPANPLRLTLTAAGRARLEEALDDDVGEDDDDELDDDEELDDENLDDLDDEL